MKRVIRLGDPHTHGGRVITAAANTEINGKRVARRGDKAVCPKKGHGVVTIVEGDPSWHVEGQAVALEGHKCSCGCSLISTLPTLGRSFEGAGSASGAMAASVAGLLAPKVAEAASTVRSAVRGAGKSGSAVVTGLGDGVDELVAKSPTLQSDLQRLQQNRWTIKYGPEGSGSTADRRNKIIQIDGAERGDPAAATQSLAHEIGHASYEYKPDYSSRSAYIDSAMADEGAATMSNIRAQREIVANDGTDIGIAGNSANHAAYNGAYDQFLQDGDMAAARQAIGAKFGAGEVTSNTGQSYADYYGGWYDKAFPARK